MPFIDDTSTSDQFEERIPNAGAAKEAGACRNLSAQWGEKMDPPFAGMTR
jgi:hypothetical protein